MAGRSSHWWLGVLGLMASISLLWTIFASEGNCSSSSEACQTVCEFLSRTADAAEGYSFRLADAAPPGAERMFVFGPYTTEERIRNATGLTHKGGAPLARVGEARVLILFVANSSFLCSAEVPGAESGAANWEFVGDANWGGGIEVRSAVFTVRHAGLAEYHISE
jgi:hypothetical protein